MTYRERVKRVRRLAGNYNTIVANFNLEKALRISTCNAAVEKMKQLLESLSIGDVHISINSGGYIIMSRTGLKEECLYKYPLFSYGYLNGDSSKIFRDVIEELLLRISSTMSSMLWCYRLSDVASFVRDASLVMASVNAGVAEAARKIATEYNQAEERLTEKSTRYFTYVNTVSGELDLLAREWYKEGAILAPGMRVGIVNLKTDEVTIRTIKSCKITDESFSIAFNESSSRVTDPDRIHIGLTWYLNNGECSDIAKAIKWKPIADFV